MLTVFFLVTAILPARAERPLAPRAGRWTVGAELGVLNTDENYNSDGDATGGVKFDHLLGALRGSYDVNNILRLKTAVSIAQSKAEPALGGANSASHTQSGLNEVSAGALAWFQMQQFALAPDMDLVVPVQRVNEESDVPLIGEGALRARFGGWAILKLDPVQPFAFAGYEFRDGGRSSQIPYALGAHLQTRNWWLQGEFRGAFSAGDDADSGEPTVRVDYLRRVDGGSFAYYAVEPSFSELAAESGFRVNGWNFFLGFATTVRGRNFAKGNTFYGGISFSTGSEPERERIPPKDRFEMEQHKYDESLFNKDPAKPESRKIRKKVRKHPSMEKMLHETEKDLQNQD